MTYIDDILTVTKIKIK